MCVTADFDIIFQMKRLILSNLFLIGLFTALHAGVYLPHGALGFEPFNRYIDLPSAQTAVEYVLPRAMPYTMKYVTGPHVADADMRFRINDRQVIGVESVVRGDHKTFRCDIAEDYFMPGPNRIEFVKGAPEPADAVNKFTLRNFKKNVFDLNIFLIDKPRAGYLSLLQEGAIPAAIGQLAVYGALFVLVAVIGDAVLLKICSLEARRLARYDMWCNAALVIVGALYVLSQVVLPFYVVAVPLYKIFSVFVILQTAKWAGVLSCFYRGGWADRLYAVFLALFAGFVMLLLTDMEQFARPLADAAYLFLAAAVGWMTVRAVRETAARKMAV